MVQFFGTVVCWKRFQEEKRTNSPTTDMHNLVSDLNSFLKTTQKEIHTPKNTKKRILPVVVKKEEPEIIPNLFTNAVKVNLSQQQQPQQQQQQKEPQLKFGLQTKTPAKNAIQQKNEKWSCVKCTLINPGQ